MTLWCNNCHCSVLYCTVLYCTVLYCVYTILQYCGVLYCSVLYCVSIYTTSRVAHQKRASLLRRFFDSSPSTALRRLCFHDRGLMAPLLLAKFTVLASRSKLSGSMAWANHSTCNFSVVYLCTIVPLGAFACQRARALNHLLHTTLCPESRIRHP